MELYRTFLNASRVSNSYLRYLCQVLVGHNLGEYFAGLLTGSFPGSSLSTEEVATAKLHGGDYAWLPYDILYLPNISKKIRIVRDYYMVLQRTTDGD